MGSSGRKRAGKFTRAFRGPAVGRALATSAREQGTGERPFHYRLTRHRRPEGTGAFQAGQAAEIVRLKRGSARKNEGAVLLGIRPGGIASKFKVSH